MHCIKTGKWFRFFASGMHDDSIWTGVHVEALHDATWTKTTGWIHNTYITWLPVLASTGYAVEAGCSMKGPYITFVQAP